MSKQLKGTINDPFRGVPSGAMPDRLRALGKRNGGFRLSDVGFADPGFDKNHPPALKRQLSLLNGDTDADYFLFDNLDRPIRFRLPDSFLRMQFRLLRAELFAENLKAKGFEAVAEYLIKAMQGHPGLGRERIMGQLRDEYGNGVDEKMRRWAELAVTNGMPPGQTFLEDLDAKMSSTLPQMMALHPEIMRK